MEDISLPGPAPEKEQAVIPSHLDFPVVGIGASAGGLQALLRFFENMPADNGMAFVIIMHLSPRHESNADSVLQRATKMPVVQVTKPQPIQKNHIYVIPPKKQLSMNDSFLSVADLERPRGQHVAIDLFFRALADVHRERAIGIVLSGTGADGAIGLARIKEQGGVTLAQNPGDAEHDGMPLAAIGTGDVDFILPVIEMPQKLIDIGSNARRIELPAANDPDAAMAPMAVHPASDADAEKALIDVLTLLRTHTGHDFRHYKRATVLRRIERRLQVRGVANLPAYRALLEADGPESMALLNDMLIGVTNFFRDREAFEALERDVLPQLFHNRQGGEQVRAWVAACSTGEEAYSLAMLLTDQASLQVKPPGIQVFGTDIDEHAIAVARSGTYPASIATDVPPGRLRQFFTKEDDRYRIRKIIRDRILFAEHNLLRDPPFSKLDLITCRNLLIYLNREVQAQVLEMFHFSLNPGGFLFLGSSESAEALGNFFTPFDKKNRIYRARVPRATRRRCRPASPPGSRCPTWRACRTSASSRSAKCTSGCWRSMRRRA